MSTVSGDRTFISDAADLASSHHRRASLATGVVMTPGDAVSMDTTELACPGDVRPRRQHGKRSCVMTRI